MTENKLINPTKLMNHYDILNLPTNATGQEIKVAYRRLVKKFHPGADYRWGGLQADNSAWCREEKGG